MSSIPGITNMRARALTIMATRSQDQDLVVSVAKQHGISDRGEIAASSGRQQSNKIVPAFGWHPWFSYQLYDDTTGAESNTTYEPSSDSNRNEQKAQHYNAVLSPAPDAEFIASLPDPRSLRAFIDETRQRVLDAGPAALIGEIGLDKAFRLPWPRNAAEHSERDEALTPGGREGRMLSPHHVRMAHQVRVLKAQLRLAGELGVAVSVHGVQAHGVLFDALASLWKGHEKEVVSRRKQKLVAEGAEDFSSSSSEGEGEDGEVDAQPAGRKRRYKPKPFPPRVCLHSFSGSPQMVSQYLNPAIPVQVFFSFSTVINLSTAGGESKFPDVVRACPDDRVLVESDLHTAGEHMDHVLEDMYRRICDVKGWSLSEGVEKIRKNYERFIFG
ncbi:hypothetical protein VTK26DRAFT_4727 [Humicola hyalothermophila]